MKRKIITYFLLCVMAIQLLPIKEMGMLLYNNQLTEEICDALDTSEEKNDSKESKKEFTGNNYSKHLNFELNNSTGNRYALMNTILKSRYSDDTITPPPLG